MEGGGERRRVCDQLRHASRLSVLDFLDELCGNVLLRYRMTGIDAVDGSSTGT